MRRRDALAWIGVGGAGVFTWSHFGKPGAALDEVYVSEHGTDWNSGQSKDSPVRTIGRALAIVRSGGEVRILAGKYRERVHVRRGGRRGRPLVISAVEPGSVTITWESPRVLSPSTWRSEGDGISSTAVGYPVYSVRHGDEQLFRALHGASQLRRYVQKADAWSSFSYENGRLYVYLRQATSGKDAPLVTHDLVPQPREWGEFKSANMWIEADHVVVRGIRFDFGIGASVRIWNAQDVTISDCSFTGAAVGVRAAHGRKPARGVRVERCLYHNYPQHHWRDSWLSWQDLYASVSSNTLVESVDPDTQVLDCIAAHCGDALRVSTLRSEPEPPVTIAGNWIALTTDDAVELDGAGSNVLFRDNFVYRAHVAVAATPVTEGPAVVERNLCVGCQCNLKLVSPTQPGGSVPATRNLTARNNLFVGGYPTYWSDKDRFENCSVSNNVFVDTIQEWQGWPKGVTESGNVWARSTAGGSPNDDAASSPERFSSALAEIRGEPPFDIRQHAAGMLGRTPGPSWWSMSHPATKEVHAFASAAAAHLR